MLDYAKVLDDLSSPPGNRLEGLKRDLKEEFLAPLEMSQEQLADHIGQDVKVINRIVNRRSAVTAES